MQWLSEATTETFEREVIERSRGVVVLVDFWADWCGPCRVLAPILEAAVGERRGEVWLVKVDTDRNRELAGRYEIRGIPAVKAFSAGQLVGEFVGAQDRRAVDAFIDRVSPSREDRALARAAAALAEQRAGLVPALLEHALASPPHRDRALLLTARAQLATGQHDAAAASLAQIPAESLEAEQAERLGMQLELRRAAAGADEATLRDRLQQRPDDPRARWALAGLLYTRGLHREALELLLELLQRDRAFGEDGARRAILAIFEDLGPTDELVREMRRRLQIYL